MLCHEVAEEGMGRQLPFQGWTVIRAKDVWCHTGDGW